jgi:tripartite-type tricarboxylate transporter receptor subunit TctC
MNHPFLFRLLCLATALVSFASAQAQDNPAAKNFPDKSIHVIVGYAAGGANDLVARVLSQKLGEALGQAVVVENKVGASGSIAAAYTAKANPDGYTLLFAPSSMFTTNPVMFKKLPYALSDFAPISMVATFPLFVVVGSSQPFQSTKDLVEYLKINPKKANFAGAAGIHQLAFELFKSQTGTTGEYIAYKGTNQSVAAVMTGDVLMSMADAAGVAGQLKSGQVRGLAVTSRERLTSYPNIPTVAEAGYPGLEMGSWMGLLAPAATPAPIVKKLQQEVNRIVKTAAFKERMNSLELKPETSTPEEFALMINSELARWRAVAKASNIEATD